MDHLESNHDGRDRCGKQFLGPTFTPPADDLGDSTCEFSDDQYLYLAGDPIDDSPRWRRYEWIDGAFVDITPDVEG